jgi:hypothetical protein
MKTILATIAPLFIFCFGIKSNSYFNSYNAVTQDSVNYKVYKIDSINNYYLIYAKRGTRYSKSYLKRRTLKSATG